MGRPEAERDVFRAVADPTRREILDMLRQGERPVLHLVGHFEISQPAISQHLRVLRELGLVEQRKDGRKRFYRLSPSGLKDISDWIAHYEQFWADKLIALGEHLRRQSERGPDPSKKPGEKPQ